MTTTIDVERVTGWRSMVDLLRGRANNRPDARLFTFLVDGEMQEAHFSYGELDARARAIGSVLQSLQLQGQRALLIYPPGLDFVAAFYGALFGGCIAVPCYPPHPARPEKNIGRVRAIAKDAQPAVVLTATPMMAARATLVDLVPELDGIPWVDTQQLDVAGGDRWIDPDVAADDVAFLQYTSGSTATPKGVMVTHGNLIWNSRLIAQGFGHTEESCAVIWTPPYHDMGLIGGIVQPLYAGFHMVLMAPAHVVERPGRWLSAISRFRATTSGGPNFVYALSVRKVGDAEKQRLDLSHWKLAFNGAEPVHAGTLAAFAEAFAGCGFRRDAFYPCYGLAEATLMASGGTQLAGPVCVDFDAAAIQKNRVIEVGADGALPPRDIRTLVGCGRALEAQEIVVADMAGGRRSESGEIGEILMSGPSVGGGYWRRPDDTRETFGVRLADSGATYLRTGDVGFLRDGELFVTGRLKDLIIVRGRNHYPQEIERSITGSHPALATGMCAVFPIDADSEERVAAVAEVDRRFRHLDVAAVCEEARRTVGREHEIELHAIALVPAGAVPRTTSGKVQRRACRERFLARSFEVLAERTFAPTPAAVGDPMASLFTDPAEILRLAYEAAPDKRVELMVAYLAAQIGRMLGLGPEDEGIAVDRPLAELGLSSMMAVELVTDITQHLQIELPEGLALEEQTIHDLGTGLDALLFAPGDDGELHGLPLHEGQPRGGGARDGAAD